MTEPTENNPHGAFSMEDPLEMAKHATVDQLKRLKIAEDIVEMRFQRVKRTSRLAVASQLVISAVAMGGLLVNGVQSYLNKVQQQAQSQKDQDRWNREFERAQQSDKYRAFFETSALATDPTNADKRLVGYALLQEFVQDKDYNSKATLMLEESLTGELRSDTSKEGLDDAHKVAVSAILTALSHTDDCRALESASRSIEKVSRHNASSGDASEAKEVFDVYVRRVVGRAAIICAGMKELRAVRKPLRETVIRTPAIVGAKGPLHANVANAKIAEVLRDRCQEDLAVNGASDCSDVYLHYMWLCQPSKKNMIQPEDKDACDVILPLARDVYPKYVKQCEPVAGDAPQERKDDAALCEMVKGLRPILGGATTTAAATPSP
jgi:hypothetical protein